MRTAIFVMALFSFVFSKTYTIQVTAIKNEEELSKNMIINAEQFGNTEVISENGYSKIRVGSYESIEQASDDLLKIQKELSSEAFVVEQTKNEDTKEVDLCAKFKPTGEKKKSLCQIAREAKAKSAALNVPKHKGVTKAEVSAVSMNNPLYQDMRKTKFFKDSSFNESQTIVQSTHIAKPKVASKAKVTKEIEEVKVSVGGDFPNLDLECDTKDEKCKEQKRARKKSEREQEIAEAISFYANSKYHTFGEK